MYDSLLFLPLANQVAGKVTFSLVSVILSMEVGGYAWSQVPSGGGWVSLVRGPFLGRVDMPGPRSLPGRGGYTRVGVPGIPTPGMGR